ncbi:HNH/endonuclease VII fold toxin-2 domain-containing protein [Massilia sp. DJPM01]|uniref:HNH/endonuclease VII fold toxin-2 domain-containing protein n=1 Tax=Massilia sp. DJPM01 TaxID=3024404 RepID=UPI00259EE811|nr:HNH/endonuclease VII fold toxin-2 domain-containing protein [Massilia sp. DJPM01]MDM5177743.1 HNH/endonuclease VII fold toxin-2 domain-containing protein [Massilia sp. DJPM01]
MNWVRKSRTGKSSQDKSDAGQPASKPQDGKPAKRYRDKGKAGNTNTGPMFYFSNRTVRHYCLKETSAIKKHCDEDKAESKKSSQATPKTNSKLGQLSEKIHNALDTVQDTVKKEYGYDKDKPDTQWMDEHCDGLWLKPMGTGEFKHFTEQLQKIENDLKKEAKAILESGGAKVIELAKDTALAYGQKAAMRTGAAAVSLVVPVVGEVVMVGTTIWNFVDGAWTAGKVAIAALNIKDELMAKYKLLEPKLGKIQDLLSPDKQSTTASSVVAEMMTEKANFNPCIKARKCSLVPYDETLSPKDQATTGQGCCPGQTGHHIVPSAMFDVEGNPCGNEYDYKNAPTVCLEGTNNHVGSHGSAHKELERLIDEYKEKGLAAISYKEASKRGIEAVRLANPNCSEKCLQAQLDKYYKDDLKCKNDSQLKPNPGKPDPKVNRVEKPQASTTVPTKTPRAKAGRKK